MKPYTVTALANEHCATGENPFWNPEDGTVWWTDIPAGKLFRYNTSTGRHHTVYEGEPVGGFTLQDDGTWLLFRVRDIAVMTRDGGVVTLFPFVDETAQRFNDVIADPQGRVFAGTIGTTRESGGLYRVDRDGAITKLWEGTGVANGMGFSPDVSYFYWTCSTTRRIFRYRYDPETGAMADRTLFYAALPDEGTPDGLAVDADGNVWSARNRGGCLLQHSRDDGRVIDRIDLPVAKVTSLIFGGPSLDTMYVTTGGGNNPQTEADGTLYAITGIAARGQTEFRSRIYPVLRN